MAQPGSGSSRTPFDNDLVNDPHAPRDTQPLTPRSTTPPGAPQVPGSIPPSGTPVNASRHLPPQVVTRGHNDDTAPHGVPTGNLTKRLPTSTLVGFALAGGAVGVVLLSMIVRSVLPGPKNQVVYTPEGAPPPAPRVVIQPPADGSSPQAPQSNDFANRSIDDTTLPAADVTIESRPETRRNEAALDNGEARTSRSRSDSARESDGANATSGSTRRDAGSSQTRDDRDTNVGDSSSVSSANRDDSSSEASSTRGVDSSGGRYASQRGYAITPPEGYTLQRSGRRTVWRGPRGEQILVETGSTNGTPREGWERLDKALSRKYGSKYRNRGIRETTLAGKPAAVWEFEIDTPSGTQRKIDIAVHHQGRGYAVLGQAPAERFEEARPRIEAAIQSFELQRQRDAASSTRAESTRTSTRRNDNSSDDDAVSTRARRSERAPRSERLNNRNTSERNTAGGQSRRDAAPEDDENDGDDAPPVRSEGY